MWSPRDMHRCLVFVLLAACPQSEVQNEEHSGNEETVESEESSATRASCPAGFESSERPTCEGEDRPECEYSEGNCYCGQPPWCSGDPQPDYFPDSWICVRRCPAAGTACDDPDAQCPLHGCNGGAMRCIDGQWVSPRGPNDPPPPDIP